MFPRFFDYLSLLEKRKDADKLKTNCFKVQNKILHLCISQTKNAE